MTERHDVYVTPQGKSVTVLHSNILVRPDPLPERTSTGLLHLPTNAMEDVNNTGTVVAYGHIWVGGEDEPQRRIPIPEIYIGMRVMFIRFLGEVHTTKSMQAAIDDNIIKMDVSDILLVLEEEDVPGVEAA